LAFAAHVAHLRWQESSYRRLDVLALMTESLDKTNTSYSVSLSQAQTVIQSDFSQLVDKGQGDV
jgi:hypothetical protein